MASSPLNLRWKLSLLATLLWCVVCCVFVAVPGCRGCREEDPVAKKKREDEEEKKKKLKEKEKPKPDFDASRLITFPDDSSSELNYVKHGHWVTANQLLMANNFDFHGEMDIEIVDSQGRPIDLEKTPFQITLTRPTTLPKGQARFLETVVPLPRQPRVGLEDGQIQKRNVGLKRRLRSTRGSGGGEFSGDIFTAMPDHQFYVMVLSRDSDSYTFMRRTTSAAPPAESFSDTGTLFYRFAQTKSVDELIPLPTSALTWTSIAYVVWDDLPPERLSPEQQDSLLDWLHWGGQLIVSGPGSLDGLRGSFLDPYLPVEKTKAVSLDQSAFDELNRGWSLRCNRKNDPQLLSINNGKMVAVEWKKHPDAQFVANTGELVAERRVGGGRIVVTAFALNDPRVMAWRSFDNFFNGVLLRRPGRIFRRVQDGLSTDFVWKGFDRSYSYDPRLISTLRYFTRDIGYPSEKEERELFDLLSPTVSLEGRRAFSGPTDGTPTVWQRTAGRQPSKKDWHFAGYSYTPDSGVAGWNDFSGAAAAARKSLAEAAGIDVPDASFVTRVLLMYLIVLVPLNWGFFRLIRRVEWAWAMAPVIAIVGAIMVVRYAQLDIGFIRSRTELGVLELQGDYSRGHLTRYTSLYTSLSTGYDITTASSAACLLPMADSPPQDRSPSDFARHVGFFRDRFAKLSGFPVDSNSTRSLHCEEIWNAGGSISLVGDDETGWNLKNNSKLKLQSAGVFHRDQQGVLHHAWLGDVAAQTSTPLRLSPTRKTDWEFEQWQSSPVMGKRTDSKGEVTLSGVIQLAIERLELRNGDFRLLAYSDEDLSGIEFRPAASQTLTRTLVLCHLKRGQLDPAEPDENTLRDIEDDSNEKEDAP